MKTNPLSSLLTPEQEKYYNKIRLYSFFYPFKRKKLNQVGNDVKKILEGFNITYPLVFNFKDSREFSKYALGYTDSTKYMNYKIFIYYNPRFIAFDYNELIKTGLHEYCHIIYRQKEDFSNKLLQQFFLDIDYDHFIESIDHLTKKFVLKCIPQIPPTKREILRDPKNIEEFFAEGFAGYFIGYQGDIFIEEKKHFEIIVSTHIKIMKGIRHLYFGEML